MAQDCFSSLDLCAIRIAQLQGSGAPSTGATNGLVSNGMVKLQVQLQIDKGQEFVQKTGCGDIAISFKEPDRLKNTTLNLELVILDLLLMQALAGVTLFTHAGATPTGTTGSAMGFQLPPVTSTGGTVTTQFASLEAWTRVVSGTRQQLPSIYTTGTGWWQWVFPQTYWTIGQFSLINGIATFPVDGTGVENPAITADGPFNDWPTDVQAGGGVTRVAGAFFSNSIPTASCSAIAVP